MIGGAKGIGIGIDFGIPNQYCRATSKPYIEKDVLDSLRVVASAYGKSNNDADRSIVKNLVDASNPFVISNAAFKLNSGFGKYEVDFTVYNNQNVLVSPNKIVSIAGREIISLLPYTELSKTISSYKIKVTGLIGELSYWYRNQDGSESRIIITKDGIYQLSTCYNVENGQGSSVGFNGYSESSCTIEQIPSFEGAFVTDGIADLITSTKTVQEMLGGSNEITVVSMIHQVKDSSNNVSFTNYIKGSANGYFRNIVNNYDKTGIYGYTSSDLMALSVVNNILGDKNDYTSNGDNRDSIINGNFSVQGYSYNDGNNTGDFSSVAWYWTIIANKVLTTDQINQVIAYFNLDRTLKSDIYCNIAKQGITNENHAEFGDKLIDFSGNGRDIQLNNIAWDGDSGIGKYNYPNWKVTATIANTYSTIVNYPTVNGTYSINVNGVSELMQSIGLHLEIKYTTSTGIIYNDIKQDGVYSYILPDGATDLTLRFGGIPGIVNEPCNITITQIPSHAGALYLDGVSDFGQFVGDLGLKDYTFIMDREYLSLKAGQVPVISSINPLTDTPFIFEHCVYENRVARPFSFGKDTVFEEQLASKRFISYQSTYKYNGKDIARGTSVNTGSGLTIGRYGDDKQYANFVLYFLMLFPYSMSEFLIERQLKKHKLGTLYPDMVEFRPVIKANANYKITYYQIDSTNTWKSIKVGDYIVIGAKLAFQITFDNDASELKEVVSPQLSGIIVEKRPSNPGYNIYSYITSKSPQKINITIDEYIRFEDIVQPYPVLLRFNDENGNEVSWGGKFRVGSTITRIGSIADPESNLLNGLYSISGLSLNGKAVTSSTHIVEKQMVFKTTATYLLDDNEPKCILSPRLLRIPNSSYKILGHIPDISGHGNNGVIHNSAYAEGSGVNEDGSYQFDGVDDFVTIPTLSHGGKQVFMKTNWLKSPTLLYDQRASGSFAILTTKEDDATNLRIAYQGRNQGGKTYIDGIENNYIETYSLKGIIHNITVTNPSAGSGVVPVIGANTGKSNNFAKMSLYDFMLFDEISTDDKIKELNEYVGIEAKVELPPYYWDNYGKTNLDEDKNYTANLGTVKDVIEVSQPAIFAENWYDYYESFVSRSPIINQTDYSIEVKPTHMDNNFMMMLSVDCDTPLPAFRAKFTRTSNVDVSNAEIRYVYYVNGKSTYIDIFGENNSAESVILDIPASEKSSISGSNADNFPNILIEVLPADNSVRYGLSNKNFAYDKMSGFGGYEFAKFDNTSEWIFTNNSDTIEVVNRDGYTVVLRKVGNGTNYWHFRNTVIKSLGQDIRIGVYANKSVQIVWQLKYKLEGDTDYNTLAIASPTIEGNINTYVTLPYKTEQEIADLNAIDTYYSIYFIPIDLNIDEEVTIEMLPLYPNGLVYDGITDYSENANIPAFTEFSYVFKRKLLSESTGSASMNKGLTDQQRAVVVDHINANGNIEGTSFGTVIPVSSLRDSDIIYSTTNNINGTTVSKGSNPDSNGIDIGRFVTWYKQMVFYKLMLYPKTIPLLQINFLKNLMEKDEIIDLNNPIFIQ